MQASEILESSPHHIPPSPDVVQDGFVDPPAAPGTQPTFATKPATLDVPQGGPLVAPVSTAEAAPDLLTIELRRRGPEVIALFDW